MIKATGITKSFGELQVLKGVDMQVQRGEIVTIVGASGAGKTTLLQIVGTLSKPEAGHIYYGDIEVSKLNDKRLARFRNRNIGFVFQFHHLLPEFTAFENICIPGYIARRNRIDVEKKAHELMGFLRLEKRKEHKPNELSGGEQQRVAVARALINDPEVVLADEPSGNLDSQNKEDLHNFFFSLREQYNQTFLIVTHDRELAGMTDRMLTIHDGRFT